MVVLGTILIIVLIFTLRESRITSGNEDKVALDTIDTVPEPVLKFGLPVDSFEISEGVVRRNQNLSDILTGYGVDMATIDRLARSSRDTFDVRRIRSGQHYFVFQTRDTLREPCYFVYENSETSYVVFELTDSMKTYNGRKEVDVSKKSVHGIIESSLWNSMVDKDVSPVLALDMSEVYAWTIDFFGIQKGDRYRVIYEEQFVDGKSVGIGPIMAAQFNHKGVSFFAFRFSQQGDYNYFDENGVNLRKAFLKAPLRYSRISSRFSNARMNPVLKIIRPHHGVDYAAPLGTPVHSIGDGYVIAKGYEKAGGGNYIKIKHNSVYTTSYMHLSKFAKGIAPGVHVKQNDVIGYVGMTGLATGPHLDFRIYKNGRAVDPLRVKSDPGKPVSRDSLASFMVLKDSLMNELQAMKWQ